MKQIVLKVQGMSCMHCAKSVERYFKSNYGVKNVKVNLEEATAVVDYNPKDISTQEISESLKGTNFTVV